TPGPLRPSRPVHVSFGIPKPINVFHGGKCTRLHPVDVQRSVQMIDLMLQDTCVPTLRCYCYWLCPLVQTLHTNVCSTTYHSTKTHDAETTFKEIDRSFADHVELR